jgi:hypothetical protein
MEKKRFNYIAASEFKHLSRPVKKKNREER